VILGPSTFNFAEAARGAVKAGAAIEASDALDAVRKARELAGQPQKRAEMGEAGRRFVSGHRGAVARLAAAIAAAVDAKA